MRNLIAASAALFMPFAGASTRHLEAQDSTSTVGQGMAPANSRDSTTVRFARYRKYPWNGVNVWAGSAYETRSAAHNEHFAGSMHILGVQASRDLWRGKRLQVAYLGEVLPVMLVRSGPPAKRIPDTLHTPAGTYSLAELKRFSYRDAYGFGVAPLGMETLYRLSRQTSALFNITAGGLLFNKIVPYGKSTKPNFTVSPGIALQWQPANRTRVAFGYTFHHLSNASFGEANPGMNSQLLYLRFSRLRQQRN